MRILLLTLYLLSLSAGTDACQIQISAPGTYSDYELLGESGGAIQTQLPTSGQINADGIRIDLSQLLEEPLDIAILSLSGSSPEIEVRLRNIAKACSAPLFVNLPQSTFKAEKKRVQNYFEETPTSGFSRNFPKYIESVLEFRERRKGETATSNSEKRKTLAKAAFNVLRFAAVLTKSSDGVFAYSQAEEDASTTINELVRQVSACADHYPRLLCDEYKKITPNQQDFAFAVAKIEAVTAPTLQKAIEPRDALNLLIPVRDHLMRSQFSSGIKPLEFWMQRIAHYQGKLSPHDFSDRDATEVRITVDALRQESSEPQDRWSLDANFLQRKLERHANPPD